MGFIKKNYEKVLLGGVLLGLVGCLLGLPVIISHDKEALQDIVTTITTVPPKPLPALDVSQEDAAMGRVQAPYSLDFEHTNRLFNPVQWQRTADGRLIKLSQGNEVGPDAVVVTRITPLYRVLKLDHFDPANQFSAARYVISIKEDGAVNPGLRLPRQHYLSAGEKDEVLSLVSVTGPANNPQLSLQILSSGEALTLSQSTPFQEVDGYMADLTYPPEGQKWNNQREGMVLKFNGREYKVVVIDTNEVVLSDQSNQKKTTRPYQP